MKWSEIINEEDSVLRDATEFILDLIVPYEASGLDSIPVEKVLDALANNPQFHGINVDDAFIMDALKGIPDVTVEPDPNGGGMAIMIKGSVKHPDQKNAEKDKERINQAALRTLDKEMK